jgi:hypothetical protein
MKDDVRVALDADAALPAALLWRISPRDEEQELDCDLAPVFPSDRQAHAEERSRTPRGTRSRSSTKRAASGKLLPPSI